MPEQEGNWFFTMSSSVYGRERFGPYDTKEDAEAGIQRIKDRAAELDDGIYRDFGRPYQRRT